jgi:hypothetical protein
MPGIMSEGSGEDFGPRCGAHSESRGRRRDAGGRQRPLTASRRWNGTGGRRRPFYSAAPARTTGEDNMDVVDRKQFVAACGDPLVASLGLTLRAMPIAAGVEEDGAMAAFRTLIPVASERCRAAVLDGSEHP